MPCPIEIKQTIQKSIDDKLPDPQIVMSKEAAKKIVDYLNKLWSSAITKLQEYSGLGGYRVVVNSLDDAVSKEFKRQKDAESEFERDLDFFQGDEALFEQEQRDYSTSNQSNNVQYQLPQGREIEEFVASEKTIRDLAARISDRIGIPVQFESDRTKEYKGKIENNTAVINLAYATLDTPIHEILGHPIIRAIKKKNDIKAYYELETTTDKYTIVKNQQGGSKVFNTLQEANDFIARENTTTLYQSLLKELETGRGKEVFDRIKRDYVKKEKYKSTENLSPLTEAEKALGAKGRMFEIKGSEDYYTLEEQQEEAIVELMSLMVADKLNKKTDKNLISLLKQLLQQINDFIRSLLNQKELRVEDIKENNLDYLVDKKLKELIKNGTLRKEC